ncbi:hypothetical protein GDO78_021637 [Eleutherodactylus coqui]|uniref:Uncharacterized protein n=1 Tax=Eleutherodactylus coqui TaxID=57060 RepID=A0A8J6EHA7_ELECQ|nr:hypothetical protein GDO78_021637 [Eleutherodactylus coqui]
MKTMTSFHPLNIASEPSGMAPLWTGMVQTPYYKSVTTLWMGMLQTPSYKSHRRTLYPGNGCPLHCSNGNVQLR